MNALETEILEKLLQLDSDSQRRIIQEVEASWEQSAPQQDWEAWLDESQVLRTTLSKKYYGQTGIDVTALLREVREED